MFQIGKKGHSYVYMIICEVCDCLNFALKFLVEISIVKIDTELKIFTEDTELRFYLLETKVVFY